MRELGPRDTAAVLRALAADPVTGCMVAARVEEHGVEPRHLQGQLWTHARATTSLCFSGANLIPLAGSRAAVQAFTETAGRRRRSCSSLVGPAPMVLEMWAGLEPVWGPARDLRASQPLLALHQECRCPPDSAVRQVRIHEVETYLPAAIAMFTEEVGVDPRGTDGGRSYRRRVGDLIAAGRAWARFEGGEVMFKAEVGSLSRQAGQIQGVWVHPEARGRGLGATGTAAVAQAVARSGRIPSLYVNDYNEAARRAYTRVGFEQVGTFATVLLS